MRRFIVRVKLTTWKITLNASDSRSFWFVNSVKCRMVRGMFASSKTFGAVISRVNDMVFLIFIPRHGKLILFSVGLTPFTKSTNAHLLCWLEKDTCTKPLRLCTFWKLDFTIFLLRNYVNLRHNLSLHLEEFLHWLWNLTTMPPDFFTEGWFNPSRHIFSFQLLFWSHCPVANQRRRERQRQVRWPLKTVSTTINGR